MLFLLKIMLPPILVALVSLVQRRWGPTIGGLLMGLPWMTGPVTFFLGVDRGDAFVAGAAHGVVTGVYGIATFMLLWGLMTRRGPWWVALPLASLGFAATTLTLRGVDVPLWLYGLGGASALLAARALIAKPTQPAPMVKLPAWDIPARMVTTLALVACIMTLAEKLGPALSGTLATFPVILTVIASFTHQQGGGSAVVPVLKGIAPSLVAFTAFFVVVGYTVQSLGLVQAFALAAATALSVSGTFLIATRRASNPGH